MKKPTKAQLRIFSRAYQHPLKLAEPHWSWQGLKRANWHATMSRLVAQGWFRTYPHGGGYELTELGIEVSGVGQPAFLIVKGQEADIEHMHRSLQEHMKDTYIIPRDEEDTDGTA
ncbi:hypothetical protein HOU02_gp274 [Caulobacter phage CcrBL9]|uniref:Uncharacterized protein n=1 Tax=Caulobacter phage CcrBL9 TaxID=2283270 RepID=A0A385EC40_9CAUD|nr:hypothetical protein HOU02_gp274 [Caulobacter phage CcrBL9]AXQ69451.1 hypothetical protein CcrBL9_gp427 [Caulobacter phage CcrBL9]